MSLQAKQQTIIFAAGCFWGVQSHFEKLKGVIDTTVGYAGGNYDNPTYETVLKYRHSNSNDLINYTESVKVIYDDKIISTKDLVKSFWQLHNPTQKDGQGNDIGNNYRSAIFYTNENQKYTALALKDIYQELLNDSGYKKIVTEIKPLDKFYNAEEYHQKYLDKNPYGYCPNHKTGIKFKNDNKEEKAYYKAFGKYKLGIDSQAYHIAFNSGTEPSFCQRYDKFKHTPDGYFIDIISGEKLFDTKDRFNSGSGWLSFFKSIDGAVTFKEDNSYGMKRVEVLAKKSGIHLGHVFEDAPNSQKRFCINANILEFELY